MATASIECNGCGKRFRLKPEHAGRRMRCPACGEILSAPRAEEPTEEDLTALSQGAMTQPIARATAPAAVAVATHHDGNAQNARSPGRPWFRPPAQWTAMDRLVFRTGLGCILFGIVGLLLPQFGLQFRKLGHLAPAAQSSAAWGIIFLGGALALYVAVLRGRLLKTAMWAALGVIALVLSVVGYAFVCQTVHQRVPPAYPPVAAPGASHAEPPFGPAHRGPPRSGVPVLPTPPAMLTYESLVERFGAGRVVRVRFENAGERDLTATIRAKVKDLVEAGASPNWRVTRRGGQHDLMLAPVRDLDGFAAALGIGSVTSIDTAERLLIVDVGGDTEAGDR